MPFFKNHRFASESDGGWDYLCLVWESGKREGKTISDKNVIIFMFSHANNK